VIFSPRRRDYGICASPVGTSQPCMRLGVLFYAARNPKLPICRKDLWPRCFNQVHVRLRRCFIFRKIRRISCMYLQDIRKRGKKSLCRSFNAYPSVFVCPPHSRPPSATDGALLLLKPSSVAQFRYLLSFFHLHCALIRPFTPGRRLVW
jgi:hypothetical protein